jgi:hypothetical protein
MTEIPVLAAPASGILTQPYVTAAMFQAYPHWLDLDNLVPGGVASLQTAVLDDVLLQASDWAVGECGDMLLHAHYVQGENQRTRAGGGGRVYIKPHDIPVRAITSLSYGWDPSALSELDLPATTMWIEDGREVSFVPYGGMTFTGPAIQFGPDPRPGMLTYVQWSYVAGYPSTTFASAVAEGATSAEVTDPTGILPGDVLRVFDAGASETGVSEALTVASTYVPMTPTVPPTATSVPFAAAAQNAHAAGTGITGMPRKIMQAVIAYAVAQLLREDVSAEEPASPFGPAARTTGGERGGQGSGLINDAYGWLAPYRPTLR